MTSPFADHTALATLCQHDHIRRLSLFGSTLGGTARADSGVDLLVEFEPACKPGMLGLAAIELALTALLDGRHADLRTAQDISPHFRDAVVAGAAVQYAV